MPGGGLRLVGRFFIKWRLRGRFLKFPTPPTVDRREVPVRLSILLIIMLLCVCALEKKNQVFILYHVEKIDNKILTIEFGGKF